MAELLASLTFKFRQLEKDGIKAIRKAAKKAGMIIRDEASRLAPRLRGPLQDEMTMKTRKESDSGIEMLIGPSKTAWYGRLVEHGTKPHLIQARGRGVLAAGNSMSKNATTFSDVTVHGAIFGKSVNHPGIKATPFLGPAVANKGDEAAAVYWYELEKAIDKAFDKSISA
jgi:HK97 gp10 family phage protein